MIEDDPAKNWEELDRYFFNYHCSWDCLVEYMSEFFDVDKEPEVTVINGVPYSRDELDENGIPINQVGGY